MPTASPRAIATRSSVASRRSCSSSRRASRRTCSSPATGTSRVPRSTRTRDCAPKNRTHARARAELNAHLARTGFVDIWRHLHPDERGYTWFNARARTLDAARVDYIVISPDLVPRVHRAEILPRHRWSDHAPLAVEIENPSE